MRYTASSTDDFSALTFHVNRAQLLLDALLDDIEQMPPSSIQFRVRLLDKVTTFCYRLAAVRKTMVALRTHIERNRDGLTEITRMVADLYKQMQAEKRRLKTDNPPTPPITRTFEPLSTPTSPTAASTSLPPEATSASSVDNSHFGADTSTVQTTGLECGSLLPLSPAELAPRIAIANASSPTNSISPQEKANADIPVCDSFVTAAQPHLDSSQGEPRESCPLESTDPFHDPYIYSDPSDRAALAAIQKKFPTVAALRREAHARLARLNQPHLFADPNGKFSADNPPELDDLFPIPYAPTNPPRAAEGGHTVAGDGAGTPKNFAPMAHLDSTQGEPRESCPPQPENDPATIALDRLESRFPLSLTYASPADLPERSNNPYIYAPLFDLDVVPLVNTVPVFPIHAPDIESQLTTELETIASATTHTRTDLQNPDSLDRKPSTPDPADLSSPCSSFIVPSSSFDSSDPPLDPGPSTLAPQNSSLITPHTSPAPEPDAPS